MSKCGAGIVWSVKDGGHVGDSIGCLAFGEVMVVIEMLLDVQDDWEVHKVTNDWNKAENTQTGINQV